MAGEGLTNRPPRVTIANVDTGRTVDAQFNPDEVKEKLGVNYNALEIMGLSHKPMQYKNTSNLQLTFELGFNALATDGDRVFDTRKFLHSLCYAKRGAGDVIGGGPPKVLFSWPNLYSLTCVITNLDFTHKRFNQAMRNVVFTCAVTIEEARTTRLTSEDVLSYGTLRSS
jgi:hypothetical protein